MKPIVLVGQGRTAEVLEYSKGRVLKLYIAGFSQDQVNRERKAQAWAFKQGLPVPRPGRSVKINDRYGFTMERVEGPNGMDVIYQNTSMADNEAIKLADLQIVVNEKPGGSLPDRREFLRSCILKCQELSSTERRTLNSVLDRLPPGTSLLHGDFHPGNLIWSQNGPVMIDWVDACRGDPVADVARSLVLFGSHRVNEPAEDEPRSSFTKVYLDTYRNHSNHSMDHLDDWLLVTSAARMIEGAAKDDVELRFRVHQALKHREER